MTDTPTPSIEEVAARTKRRAEATILMHPVKGRADVGPFADRDGYWGYGPFAEDALATITALQSELAEMRAALEPFANYHGDLPDYDHPLRPVYESGIQYAVELLATILKVEDYTPCDGTEEFDGDLGGTMMNIVLAAMPTDEHGDPMHPQELRATLKDRPNTAKDG